MKILLAQDSASQKFRVQAGERNYTIICDYNGVFDRWFVSLWRDDGACPVACGIPVTIGVNLLASVNEGGQLWVIPNTLSTEFSTEYQKFVKGSFRLWHMTESERLGLLETQGDSCR